MSTLVTIDYDFFIRHGMYDEILMPDGETIPGELVFDWQMSEQRNPLVDDAIWRVRVHNFKKAGLDIREMTKPELSFPDFADKVGVRMGDVTPMCFYSDSHGWAGLLARDFSGHYGPLNVVNFDAHHDLGYDDDVLARNEKTGNIHCDDWAVIGLAQGWIENYTVVYPDWLGRAEWNHSPNVTRARGNFKGKIHATTWSKWRGRLPQVEVMHFCRSSAWVPPWYDEGFVELRNEFGYADCLDCTLGQSGSPYDACEIRHWDWEEIAEYIGEREAMYAQLRELNKIVVKS